MKARVNWYDYSISKEARSHYDEDLCAVAAHEAGHVVMSILVGGSFPRTITVEPGETYRGRVVGAHCNPLGYLNPVPEWQKPSVRRDVLITFAGPVAEEMSGLWYGDYEGWESDYDQAETMLHAIEEDDFETGRQTYAGFAWRLLMYKRPKRALRAVADYLLEHRTISDADDKIEILCSMVYKILGDYQERAWAKIAKFVKE